MASPFESAKLKEVSRPFEGIARKLSKSVFPNLAWDLKQAGYGVGPVRYIAATLYFTTMIFIVTLAAIMVPSYLTGDMDKGIQMATIILPVVTILLFLFWL